MMASDGNNALMSGAEQAPVCPVCTARDAVHIRDVFDDRYGCPELFQLVSCKTCGHLMTAPRIAEQGLGLLYSTYYPRTQVDTRALVEEASHVKDAWAKFRRWWEGTDNQGQYLVKRGQTILDVGCGSGLSVLEANALGAVAYGIEADPNVRRIADELNLNVHIGNLYDRPFPDVAFDLIILNQVIEHIPEPALALATLRERLKPDGRIILAFPNRNSLFHRVFGERWINWHIPFHLQHFDLARFGTMAERLGYRMVSSRTVTPNVWTLIQLRVLNHRSERGVASPFWVVAAPAEPKDGKTDSPSAAPTPRRGAIVRRFVRLTASNGLALFNRVVDALGQGDSIVVELKAGKVR